MTTHLEPTAEEEGRGEVPGCRYPVHQARAGSLALPASSRVAKCHSNAPDESNRDGIMTKS